MKKYCLLILCALIPFAGYSDYKDSQIARLTAEKQRKYAELEKCAKSVKGLQIAGISTLGLTAGGVALNVSQAARKKTLDSDIAKVNAQISKAEQDKKDKLAKDELERAKKAEQEKAKAECEADTAKQYENGQCIDKKAKDRSLCENSGGVLELDQDCECDPNNEKKKYYEPSTKSCAGVGENENHSGMQTINTNDYAIDEIDDDCDCLNNKSRLSYTKAQNCKIEINSFRVIQCVPKTCVTGYHLRQGTYYCVSDAPPSCDASKGQILSGLDDECYTCTDNKIAKEGKCEPCPEDKKANGDKCEDYSCEGNAYKSGGICRKCYGAYVANSDQTGCQLPSVLDMHKICTDAGGEIQDKLCVFQQLQSLTEAYNKCEAFGQNNGLNAYAAQAPKDGSWGCQISNEY
jgi:hypothetical protein